jgi:YD repeat-containing protein
MRPMHRGCREGSASLLSFIFVWCSLFAMGVARADTTPPSAPTGLHTTSVTAAEIDIAWTASTDNVAVQSYKVDRCTGAGCSNFAQIATPWSTDLANTSGITASSTFLYRVRAVDTSGNISGYSATLTVVTPSADTTAPAAPTGLSATAASSTAINLSWTASTDNVGVTGYLVERCVTSSCTYSQVATPATTSFGDTGLTASTGYSYRVRATDAANNLSTYSNIGSATTQAPSDTTAPSTPTGLHTTAVSATEIDIAWTASTDNVGVQSYKVDRCTGAGCSNFAQIATPWSTSLANTSGITSGGTYIYRVRAVDASGNISGYSSTLTVVATAADTTAPTAPTGLTATTASSTAINLSWTASTDNVGVTGYLVERCLTSSCTYTQIATPTTTSYSDTGLTGSTSYSYRVRAKDAANNFSGYSSTASATTQAAGDTTPPTAPSGLTTTLVQSKRVDLSWVASSDTVGVTGYRVERAGSGCTSFTQVGTPTATTFSDTTVSQLTTYCYRVWATDAANNPSGYSNIVTVTTVSSSETVTYTYDAKGRLVRVIRNGGSNNNVETDYTYDHANNRKTQVTTGASH